MESRSLLSEFQSLCRTLLPPAKHEVLEKLFKKQIAFYDSANSGFLQSAELEDILKSHLEELNSGGDKGKEVFKSIWDLNQSLKGHRRVELHTAQNGTDEAASQKNDGETCKPSTSTEGSNDESGGAGGKNEARAEKDASKDDKNQHRIQKLERKLDKLHRAIQKLSARELTLDEMDDNCSSHMQEHKLRTKFVQGWEMLCKLKKISSSTGRAKESRLVYRNSNYREINARITKLMNKPDYFPDYHDVLHLIGKVNKKYELGIDEMEAGLLAREIFVDIGKELKKRRQQDLIQSFGYASFAAADNDPAEESEELRQKLRQNQEESSKKLTEAINKFSNEQQIREARGEDLEVASADEEEVPEDDEVPGMNGLSEDEAPPAKRQKVDESCRDGMNCNTDSELSDYQEVEKRDGIPEAQAAIPEGKVVNNVTGGTDIDDFIMNDDTATILTSEDEGTSTTPPIGKADSLDDSDLSSSHSVVALSSDDDNFGGEALMSSEEEGEAGQTLVGNIVGNNVLPGEVNGPPKLESSTQNLVALPPGEGNCVSKPGTIVQVDFSCSDGNEGMPNLERYPKENSVVSGTPDDRVALCVEDPRSKIGPHDSDPIDSLGDDGLVPVEQCHAYAYLPNRGGSQSVGTMATSLPPTRTNGHHPSVGSSECIEILDSSSPSPSIPDEGEAGTEQKNAELEQDVIFISDSD